MNGIGSKYSMRTALLVSSVIFAVIHGLNPGMSLILWINLVLIAIFFGLYIICFDNILELALYIVYGILHKYVFMELVLVELLFVIVFLIL